MKRSLYQFSAALVLMLLLSSLMHGQIPKTISFQGVLTDSLGKPVGDGQWGLTFRLYDDSAVGSQLWNESKVLETNRGLFSTILGDAVPFSASVQFDRPYWLSIQAGGQPEMSPRIPLTAVGYSIHSGSADTAKYAESVPRQMFADSAHIAGTVPNGSLTGIKIANSQVVKSLNNLKDDIILAAEGGATITSSGDTIKINAGSGGGGTGIQGIQNTDASLTIADPNGPTATINVANLGIKSTQIANAAITPVKLNPGGASTGQAMIWNGTSVAWGNPDGSLVLPYIDSAASSTLGTIQVINTSTTGSAYGVYGKSNSTSGVGVRGYAPRTGVSGYASNASGTAYGFYGETPSTSGYGVFAAATASSGTTYGVYGRSYSDDGYGIYGRAPLYGVYGLASATTGINYGLYGTSSSVWGRGVYGSGQLYGLEGRATATSVENYGVYGSSASTIGYGVYGVNTAASGANFGVYGETYSASGRGVQGISPYLGTYGRSEMTTGLSYGVYGRCNSTDGYGVYGTSVSIGVYGVSTATSGEKVGVYGKTFSPDGAGVWGEGPERGVVGVKTGTTGDAIVGYSQGVGNAAWFVGTVVATQFITWPAALSIIDHPLDPTNKYLYHSSVESPEMKNVYDGVVVLDANGSASVDLPGWFDALNKDCRYQLTAIGAPGPNLYIASEVNNNQFKIEGGTPGMKVSWQVTGIRKDAYAEKNRTPVEKDKAGDEVGKYLHPEVYGQPMQEGIPFQRLPAKLKDKLTLQKNNPDPDAGLPEHQAPPQSDQE